MIEESGIPVLKCRIGSGLFLVLADRNVRAPLSSDFGRGAVDKIPAVEVSTLPQAQRVLRGSGHAAPVPNYIAEIPSGPFDGEPIRYSKDRKIIYSVGNDFVDDGGSSKAFLWELDLDNNRDAAEYDTAEPTYTAPICDVGKSTCTKVESMKNGGSDGDKAQIALTLFCPS